MGAGALLSEVGERAAVSRGRRLVAGITLAAVILAGLAVHLWMPDSAASDIAGDALYGLAASLGVVLLAPRLPPLAAGAIALAWCVVIELLQLTPLPAAAASVLPAAVLLLGTVFDARDLLVYLLAVTAATLVYLIVSRALRRPVR